MIKHYGINVEDALEVSPLESLGTFGLRSDLYKDKDRLNKEDRAELLKYDLLLLERSKEFYDYMKGCYFFGDPSKPLVEWWWHLWLED